MRLPARRPGSVSPRCGYSLPHIRRRPRPPSGTARQPAERASWTSREQTSASLTVRSAPPPRVTRHGQQGARPTAAGALTVRAPRAIRDVNVTFADATHQAGTRDPAIGRTARGGGADAGLA